MSDKELLIQFFLVRPGDLGIPDVHWAGSLSEAEQWTDQRLTALQKKPCPPFELRPLAAHILRGEEVLWLRMDVTAGQHAARGLRTAWSQPEEPTRRS